MSDMKPIICGKPKVTIPTASGCDDCEALEQRVENLEENTYNKEEINELLAGISGGGGFKLVDELPEEGEPGYIYLVPKTAPETGYEQYVWTDGGWVDIGEESITLDKESILRALGYEEITVKMTDVDDVEHEWTMLTAIVTP